MSWLSKIIPSSVKKAVTAASFVIPGLSLAAPIGGTKQFTNSLKGLATGAAIATTAVAVPNALASVGVTGAAATPASTSALVAKGATAAVKGVTSSLKSTAPAPAKSAVAAVSSAPAPATQSQGAGLLLLAAAGIAVKLLFFRS